MAFSEKFLNELTDRNDIVDVVSGYVRLGKKSGSNMFGLCPFHSEKTPSFSVSPDRQIYHCFGCGKGGGVINFIMEIENLGFPEAVEFLARRANMTVPTDENDREAKKRSRMLALNKDAARFFYEQLSTPAGKAATDYMTQRGISRTVATNFGLGFAPDEWNALENAMRQKGYTPYELFDAGLVKKGKSGGWYDTFRNRLMFPVIDTAGNVIGFSGRILSGDGPKYMNSPETLVFNKGRNLFALNLAKKSKSGYILLTEGNIDVVSLHQAGFDGAVASLGTSLTPEQARLISRYTNRVIIAYDNDGAGQKAAQRAIGILEKLDLKVKVLRMRGAKDPDEFIKERGAEAFRKLIEDSEGQIDYRLGSIAARFDLTVPEQKIEFLKEAIDLLARLPGTAERQVYTMRVAEMLSIKPEALSPDVERRRKTLIRKTENVPITGRSSPEQLMQPADKALRYDDPASAAAEEGVIRLLYADSGIASQTELPDKEEFTSPALAHIYGVLRRRIDENRSVTPAALSAELSGEEMSLLVSISQKPEVLSNGTQAMRDYIKRIRDRKQRSSTPADLRELAQRLRESKGYEG